MSTPTPVVTRPTPAPSTGRCVAVGILVSLVSAALWAMIVEVSHYRVGIVASGIGLLVGVAMARTASASRALPVIGAVLALAGCLIGDFLIDAAEAARVLGTTTTTVLSNALQDPGLAADLFRIGFSGIDVFFWALAAYAAHHQVRVAVVAVVAGRQPISVAGPAAAGVSVPPVPDLFTPATAATPLSESTPAEGTVAGVVTAGDAGTRERTPMTYARIRAAQAGYRSIPRDVRKAVHRGRLPTDPHHRDIVHEWAVAYRFVAPVQALGALACAVYLFSLPAGTGLHWTRIAGVWAVIWVLAPLVALFSAVRVLKALPVGPTAQGGAGEA